MKAFWITLVIVVVLLIIVTLIGLFYLGPIVKAGVERFGPQILKVSVKVDEVNISPVSGSASVKGFSLGNPPEYKSPQAIKVGTMGVKLSLFSLTSNKILIHSVRVDAPEVFFEGGLSGNNLSKILSNVNSAAQNPNTPGNGQSTTTPGKPAPKIEIDDFVITGAKVNIAIGGVVNKVVPLPDIHLTDLGKNSNGLTPVELTRAILNALLTTTIKVVASSIGTVTQTLHSITGTLGGSISNKLGNLLAK